MGLYVNLQSSGSNKGTCLFIELTVIYIHMNSHYVDLGSAQKMKRLKLELEM